jgi:hypothetical protein
LQGPSSAPLFNHLLHKAAEAGEFGAVVDLLTTMRTSGLAVDPAAAALVRR